MINQSTLTDTLCRVPQVMIPDEVFVIDGQIIVGGKSAWGVTYTDTGDILMRADTDQNTVIHETLHLNGLVSERVVVPLSKMAEKYIRDKPCNGTRYERSRMTDGELEDFMRRNNISSEGVSIIKYRKVG